MSLVFLGLSVNPLLAQLNDAHSDGYDARYDALLATPNRYTPEPEDNVFATAPGLEQQVPRSRFTANGLVPISFNSNAEALPSDGTTSAEISPLAGLSWTTPVGDMPLRFTANLRAEFDRFPNAPDAEFDKLRATGRLQYVDPDNDQAYSPYFSYVPRVDYAPTFSSQFATRHDLNLGVNKVFNFDANFERVPFSGSSTGTVWSFGLTTFFQRRFNNPSRSSFAGFLIPSVSYVISPQWNVSGGFELEHRAFGSVNNGFSQKDWFIEPIATLEFTLPESWFGAATNATLLGRPALDIQVAYEKNWSNLNAANFDIWHAGAAVKLGWRF